MQIERTINYRQNGDIIFVIKTTSLCFIYTMFNFQMETQQNTNVNTELKFSCVLRYYTLT